MSRRRLLGLVLGGVAVLVGHGAPPHAQQNLTWVAGAVGGGWYAISNGMAELMREKAGLSIKVIAGAGAQNAVLIQKGEAEIGMGLPPLLRAAVIQIETFAAKVRMPRENPPSAAIVFPQRARCP